MTIFSDKDGFGLRLTETEKTRFLKGEKIYKLSGDNQGYFEVTLKLDRVKDPFKT